MLQREREQESYHLKNSSMSGPWIVRCPLLSLQKWCLLDKDLEVWHKDLTAARLYRKNPGIKCVSCWKPQRMHKAKPRVSLGSVYWHGGHIFYFIAVCEGEQWVISTSKSFINTDIFSVVTNDHEDVLQTHSEHSELFLIIYSILVYFTLLCCLLSVVHSHDLCV